MFFVLNDSFFFFFFAFVEMEVAKQKVRVAVARNKEEEKTKVGESSSTPKVVSKGATKRKNDRKDDHPSLQ